jgi:AraC-like DNA-binding protein
MLRRTDKSIIQIAMECGFEDQSYFSRVFKRYTGSSPRAYRGA